MNILDSIIKQISPEKALKRVAARKALEIVNSGYGNYGANTTKKSMRGWMFRGGSAKEDIEDNIDILRQRSRDAYMGVPVASAALRTLRTNVIAGGLMPTPQIDADYLRLTPEQEEALHGQIIREFSLWADSKDCDADNLDNFYQLQQLAFLSYLMNGDVFALLLYDDASRNPYKLKIRLIEADRVCSPDLYDREAPCEVKGRKVWQIIQGVETDESGKVVAYWICNKHPLADNMYADVRQMEWTRVEAAGELTGRRNIIHVMNRERAGQRRGVPLLAPVLEGVKQLGRYTEAEITAAVISSYFTVFVESENASNDLPFGEMLPPDQQIDSTDLSSIELGPGAIVGMAPGESAKFADPSHPASAYGDFVDAFTKHLGAALEIPQELLVKQFTTSYSAARGALNEFWRTCGMYRDWFSYDFCQPVYEEWFSLAVAMGRVSAPAFFMDYATRKAYTGCVWNGPARTDLSPKEEIEAAMLRISAGISTAEQETAQMTGGDYSANVKQRLSEAMKLSEVNRILSNEQDTGDIKDEDK